jgi:hypothetical protein
MDLELITTWERATIGTGCLADAMIARKEDPKADIAKDLVEAEERFTKAALELRQMIARIRS